MDGHSSSAPTWSSRIIYSCQDSHQVVCFPIIGARETATGVWFRLWFSDQIPGAFADLCSRDGPELTNSPAINAPALSWSWNHDRFGFKLLSGRPSYPPNGSDFWSVRPNSSLRLRCWAAGCIECSIISYIQQNQDKALAARSDDEC